MSGRFTHVLAALDFSDTASQVARLAATEAALHGARLTLLHVIAPQLIFMQIPEQVLPPLVDMTARLRELAQGHLQRLAAELGDLPAQPVLAVEESTDRIGQRIVDYGAGQGADLIVVGSHTHGGLERVLLGSVATYVVHHARCPVLVHKSAQKGQGLQSPQTPGS